MDAGDLHWERTFAGMYHTLYWAGGYKYKITKDVYGSWRAYYKWHNSTDQKKWVNIYGSHDTLKQAKAYCLRHNLKPRAKFKFIGRVTPEMVGEKGKTYLSKYLGFLLFGEVDKEGKFMRYRTYYMDPTELTSRKSHDYELTRMGDKIMQAQNG